MTTINPKNHFQFSKPIWILFILFVICLLMFVAWNLIHRGLFEYIGIDYRLWYSSAMIARYHGFDLIYDINLQTKYQISVYQQYARMSTASIPFWPLPLPYLSVFIMPMLLFTLVKPVTGFLLWTLFNAISTMVYLYYFIIQNKYCISWKLVFVIIIALPVFLNIIFGSVNLWMLIAFGESITAIKRGRYFTSGIWIAGLMIKPQTLLLLIPGLLLAKQYKVLTGILTGAFVIALLSFSISGITAYSGPFNTIINWPTILGDSGMSLFSLSTNLSRFLPNIISIIILISVIVITFIATMWLWFPNKQPLSNDNLELTFLASFAAACVISPHSNVHMALPLLAPGLALFAKKRLSTRIVLGWIFIPTEIFLTVSIFSIGAAHIIGGMSMLIANLIVLYWLIFKRSPFVKKLPK